MDMRLRPRHGEMIRARRSARWASAIAFRSAVHTYAGSANTSARSINRQSAIIAICTSSSYTSRSPAACAVAVVWMNAANLALALANVSSFAVAAVAFLGFTEWVTGAADPSVRRP